MVIFVDDSRDDGFSADSSLIGDIVNGLCSDVRGPLLPGLVRPMAVIMDHVLTQHQSQVTVTEDPDPATRGAGFR